MQEHEKEQYRNALRHQTQPNSPESQGDGEMTTPVYTSKRPKIVRSDPIAQTSTEEDKLHRHLSCYGRMTLLPASHVLPEPIYGKGRGLGYTDTRRLLI